MAARKEFDLDLKFGQGVEGCLAHVLLGETPGKERLTVEVKADMRAADTGNFCVEFRQNGDGGKVPSGIAVTTADYWALYWGTGAWLLLSVPYLKQIARAYYRDKSRVKLTGDNGNESVLVPASALFPNGGKR